MRKILRRRLAALAVAALAAALLFANVAGALPRAGGGQGDRPAAPPATAGAPQGAGATGQAASADPNICPSTSPQINAAGLDRQARQLASQRGSRSTGQVAPNSFCCPLPCPPPPPPPTTAPPPADITCRLTVFPPAAYVDEITASGDVQCSGGRPQSLSLLVDIEKLENGTWILKGRKTGSCQDCIVKALTAVADCVPGRYRSLAQASVSKPPSEYLGKVYSPERSLTCA